ncbi:hypothetical protein D3248_01765 [Leucobacter zeae]|nr:hypothetical protein [Leucobacter zeae]
MGHLIYANTSYEFDDRVLAHVQAAVMRKFRKQECFLLSWAKGEEHGGGRVSIWMSPSIQVVFQFAGGRKPKLNKEWVAALEQLSHSPRGMVIIAEKDLPNLREHHAQ